MERHVAVLAGGRVVSFLLRGAPLALLAALLAGAFAFQLASTRTPTYQASVALLVSRPPSDVAGITRVTPPSVAPGAYRSALWDGGVVARAYERTLGVPLTASARNDLERSVRVAVEDQDISSLLRIDVRNTSPDTAAALADAIAWELVSWDRTRAAQALERSRLALDEAVTRLEQYLARLPAGDPTAPALEQALIERRQEALEATAAAEAAVTVPAIEPLAAAVVPDVPIAPRPVFDTFVAFVVALAMTYAVLYAIQTLDPRVGSSTAVRDLTARPVLARFPRRMGTQQAQHAAALLGTRLAAYATPETPRTIIVTSPKYGRSQRGVAASLARWHAAQGDATLLVDADSRQAQTTRYLLGPRAVATPSRRAGKHLLKVGEETPFAFQAADPRPGAQAPRVLLDKFEAWRDTYDVVIIDAPPILGFADTLILASTGSEVVLCVTPARTTRRDLLAALDLLEEQHVSEPQLVMTAWGWSVPVRPSVREPQPVIATS